MNNFTQKSSFFSFRFAIVALLLLLYFPVIHAVRAYPYPIEVVQPDGTSLRIYLKGDEFCNYKTTIDGYLIAQDEQGYYKYARLDESGTIVQTAVKANNISYRTSEEKQLLAQLTANPDFSKINLANRVKRANARAEADKPMKFPGIGSPKSLVILVEYADVDFITPNPREAFNNLLNQERYAENGGTGSAKDYFKDSSNGKFDPDFVVVGPYRLSQNRVYYGANSGYDDIRPRDMVIEACRLAHEDGVDFSEYDTDGDGLVDNVFIYYAGINEAESGVAETIWPHRWTLASNSLQLDGVYVYDYACTSEISGIQGSTQMCGIGTFVHEFGHVLGLPDFYATNNYRHPTLEDWSVMDNGPYLNDGRTPPSYSAYERFFVGWLENPVVISETALLTLDPLTDSNKAYIVTQDGEHNLNGADPSPREFIMLENRQNKGWDTYLPGHGMLVTRVVYNPSTWNSNTVNNNSNSMGYELIRADNDYLSTTMDGDPFPGAQKVRSYDLRLRAGASIEKPLSNITEIDETIYFNFMNGDLAEIGMGVMIDSNIRPFYSLNGREKDVQQVEVAVLGEDATIRFSVGESEAYDIKKGSDTTDEWHKSLEFTTENLYLGNETILIRYNLMENTDSEDFLVIEKNDEEEDKIPLVGYFMASPELVDPTDVTTNGFTINWNEVEHASGYYLTVVTMEEGESTFIEEFNRGLEAPDGWTINAYEIVTSSYNSGKAFPAISLYNDNYIETEEFILPAKTFSFHMVPVNSARGTVLVEGWSDVDGWKEIEELQATRKEPVYELEENFYRFRVTFNGTACMAVDDFTVVFADKIEYVVKNNWSEENFYSMEDIDPDTKYYYRVRANKILSSEEAFLLSELVTPFSVAEYLIPTGIEDIKVSFKDILAEAFENGTPVKVYSIAGQQVAVVNSVEGLERLPKGQIYILQVGEYRSKLAL